MRIRAAGALACALAVLGAAASASAKPRAVIAFLPADSAKPLLDEFASRGMAIGMTSPTVGGFRVRQMPLDMAQGTRIPTRLYSKRIGALVPRGGRLVDWDVTLRRAEKAPGDLKPGLLASTIEQVGGRVGYAGPGLVPPILAADRAGRVKRARPGDALDVIGLRSLDELDRLLAREQFVYVVEAPAGTKLRLLASGLKAPGVKGQMHSATTRRDGLIAATDVAPTVLDYLGIPIPDDMQGEVIDGHGRADAGAISATTDRLELVTSRRAPALLWLAGTWLVALAVFRRRAVRAGLLGALWFPGTALLAAAIEPGSALAEGLIVGAGAVLLGLITERRVRWPYAPALPVAVVFAAHAIDLAAGSTLIGRSIAGPNPAGGARFFGIGNELETMLSASVLIGTGAALAWVDRRAAEESRRTPIAFAGAAIVAGLVMGAGRLGADVGAVITLGAGGAAAVIASLPGGPSRRAVVLGIAAPVLALLALVVVDLVAGGGAHLTKSVLRAHGSGDLADVVRRRFAGSFSNLGKPGQAVVFVVAVGLIVWVATRRNVALEQVPRAFGAGLVGAWFAVVIGAIANDSGPLIAEIGAVFLVLAWLYARVQPALAIHPHE